MEIFAIFVVALLSLLGFLIWRDARRAELVSKGKAAYFVKVAASGKGGVYHSLSCRKCIAWHEIALDEAYRRGYPPCATCGGAGTFKLLALPKIEAVDTPPALPLNTEQKLSKKYLAALEALRTGRDVRRTSWPVGNQLRKEGERIGIYRPSLPQLGVGGWSGPTEDDCQANDWEVL